MSYHKTRHPGANTVVRILSLLYIWIGTRTTNFNCLLYCTTVLSMSETCALFLPCSHSRSGRIFPRLYPQRSRYPSARVWKVQKFEILSLSPWSCVIFWLGLKGSSSQSLVKNFTFLKLPMHPGPVKGLPVTGSLMEVVIHRKVQSITMIHDNAHQFLSF